MGEQAKEGYLASIDLENKLNAPLDVDDDLEIFFSSAVE